VAPPSGFRAISSELVPRTDLGGALEPRLSNLVDGQLDAGTRVGRELGQGDDVDRVVELAIAAAIEPVAVVAAGADRDRSAAGDPGEFRVRAEAIDAGDLADQIAAVIRPTPLSASRSGALRRTSVVIWM
jgi:hypothetical protein